MPFVLDVEDPDERPVKRRKLTSLSDMTRYSGQAYYSCEEAFDGQGSESEETHGSEERYPPNLEQRTVMTSDRDELIQCIKRGQRPTWVPGPGLEALCAEVNAERNNPRPDMFHSEGDVQSSHTQRAQGHEGPLPRSSHQGSATESLRRSLSALHTGDFGNEYPWEPANPAAISTPTRQSFPTDYGNSSPAWLSGSTSVAKPPSPSTPLPEPLRRSRAPSLGSSLSSSFVMRVPTSPLVHATNNPSLDFSPRNPLANDGAKSARRRTLPPTAFDAFRTSPIDGGTCSTVGDLPSSDPQHEDSAFARRPRRSLSSFTYHPASNPQLPFLARSRRPSLACDVSPRHRASMVGSFEESILRGRMSTPPSKPIDFVAQIGVVGKGNCPSSLKCPAHVSVPFPAVFYNYPSTTESRSISDDNPSPYVGTIDLERNLKPLESPARRPRRAEGPLDTQELVADITSPENTAIGRALARDVQEKKEQKAILSAVPTGGAYRVPQRGQLQIIIKNPNKTAVKLFLVPYDLNGMVPGTKTFVRQRSFTSGPIVESAITDDKVSIASRDPLSNKDILRYLIHLKFCSTGKGRFYLYDNIRVVFANRVPDGKEGLRNEVQLPEPRFSPYKPTEAGCRSPSVPGPKFSSLPPDSVSPDFGSLDDILDRNALQDQATKGPHTSNMFNGTRAQQTSSTGLSIIHQEQTPSEPGRTVSPVQGFLPSTSSRSSPVPWLDPGGTPVTRGFSPAPVEAGDGLISRKLRELSGGSGASHTDFMGP
ncbi:hypothetical protein H2202_005303 [Exophiala xenobiotica]|nr:hypothetical protein H2202_005303 [Exophiala xenobiotica]